MLAEWGLEIDVGLDAADLTVEQRQIVEIARALRQGTRFIILDEPTAQLEAREVARLFERIVRLQASGVTFLYISHHLEEIYEVCRSVTVLRDGEVVADAPLARHAQGAGGRRHGGRRRRRAGGPAAARPRADGRRRAGPASRCASSLDRRGSVDVSASRSPPASAWASPGSRAPARSEVGGRDRRPAHAQRRRDPASPARRCAPGGVAGGAAEGRRLRAARPPRGAASSRSSRSPRT